MRTLFLSILCALVLCHCGKGTDFTQNINDIVPKCLNGNNCNVYPVSIASGAHHSCTLLNNGHAYCWGRNDAGQLGTGTVSPLFTGVSTPQAVQGITNATKIVAGVEHTCALLNDKTVWCWGGNSYGQLGDSTTDAHALPAKLTDLADIEDLVSGDFHNCALSGEGSVYCWGASALGQTAKRGNPVRVTSPVSIQTLNFTVDNGLGAARLFAGGNGSCAQTVSGSIRCWGNNAKAQLGNTASNTPQTDVTVAENLKNTQSNIQDLTLGENHACVLYLSGAVACWGSQEFGQTGITANNGQSAVLNTLNLAQITSLSAGANHSCFGSNNHMFCYGRNDAGQLGNGTYVSTALGTMPANINHAIQIAAGESHTCALQTDGSIYCWGRNAFGQLAQGNTQDLTLPAPILAHWN